MAFFAIKLNCQYSYLDKLQNGIPFLLLSSLFPPLSFIFSYLCALLESLVWAEGYHSRQNKKKTNESLLIFTVC